LVKIQNRTVARIREKHTREKRYEKSPSFKKTQMKALVITQEKPNARRTPKATTSTAPLLRGATNTNQLQFPLREPNVSIQVTASPPCSISRKVVVVVIVVVAVVVVVIQNI
jgi:hypothetical protein